MVNKMAIFHDFDYCLKEHDRRSNAIQYYMPYHDFESALELKTFAKSKVLQRLHDI